ncbi:complex I subunit 4 family protein [Gluconacetobacter diazotrophicus]|uniref:NADH-quinone oxidoreductase subunit M n=1 Tax=Gluconacetobacter diazotrophicus TaxID=33996 RepID=A0A7W4FC96_GLUDI|nr:NADH-quinone oxidoreductase subunit M [Gluconacetobacter diazotrophicus]MBB2155100.1 NADH-quinone oxidoreductase subunit M [Gluconacetobacter diazotrophicus]
MHPILLPLVTYLPLGGALAILLMRGTSEAVEGASRWVALWTSLIVFGLSVVMWGEFDPSLPGFQFVQQVGWASSFGISYHAGVDGISLLFVLLSTFLTPLAVIGGWKLVTTRVRDYMLAVLLLETTLVGLFSALDLVLFYVFYEATLIPGSLMIGVWGGPKRVWASIQFFLFTFGGSLFMLLALLTMWNMTGTTDIPTLMQATFPRAMQCWLLLGFVLAFGVKLPLFPLHAWLPDAYTEAPTPTSALLSGVLSKAGAYGLLRFGVLMFPEAARLFAPYILTLGVIAVIYAAIIALAQTDMKRVIAYSSFSHMGVIAVGLFTLTPEGIDGAIFTMLSHGVIITALFFCVAAVSWRAETRSIDAFSGVAHKMPVLATLAMLFVMANIGLPGTGSFVGELLVMVGAIHVSFWVAFLAGSTMILGAVYMLVLYRRVMFGAAGHGVVAMLRDLTGPELAVLVPCALVTLWMGIHPTSFLRVFDPAVVHAVAAPAQASAAAPIHLAAR